jgi:hypothetical protein
MWISLCLALYLKKIEIIKEDERQKKKASYLMGW